MKRILSTVLFFGIITITLSQRINIQKGAAAEGYDVVAYFSNKALEGSSKFVTQYEGATYRFSSETNLKTFKANPQKYLPAYGGWCAYAMATKAEKVSIDPETFEIRNGKLYLFYNAFFSNTLESWKEENPNELVLKANKNWLQIK